MKDLDKYLIRSETPVVLTRRHWASLVRTTLYCVLTVLFGLLVLIWLGDAQFFAIVGLVLLLGGLGWAGWTFASWWLEEFVITDRRVLLISGVLTKRVAIMPLSKVTDLTYERSIVGRLLGYGVFVIESAGQHQALSRIEYLPTPDELYHDVSTLLFGPNASPGHRGRGSEDNPTSVLP